MLRRAVIHVRGLVQGVGFRPFIYRIAVAHGLKGYVLNLGDAGVEIVVEGKEGEIENFIRDIYDKKPAVARIDSVDVEWGKATGEFSEFRISVSCDKRSVRSSVIPRDVAICDLCLADMLREGSRWFHYAFTACAACGPRFTIIEKLPYDRENTTMRDFPLCEECLKEYQDPMDRRYHAQGICCSKCGPQVFLVDKCGNPVECRDPIGEVARLLLEGFIVAVKGIGGFHIAADASNDNVVLELRRRKNRPQRPFAIMSLDVAKVKSYAYVSEEERRLLESFERPIVLLRKREDFSLSELIAPGLDTVGVMLPYSGLHYLLLMKFDGLALIMTSGNLPGRPIVVDEKTALKSLNGLVDYFLLHNRRIVNRCDDSVMRMVGGVPTFIRRSRGYVPGYFEVPFGRRDVVGVAVGAEERVVGSLLYDGRCIAFQHIGDVDNLESLDALRESILFSLRVHNVRKLDFVACDLNPAFLTTRLAGELAEEYGAKLVKVQHHHAHAASLLLDCEMPRDAQALIVTVDGVGYGTDGSAWGGEFLLASYSEFTRVGSFKPQPMPGGDLCAIYPCRMLAGILSSVMERDELRELLTTRCLDGFPRGEQEVDLVLNQLYGGRSKLLHTSSLGRVLDAVSALLGVCKFRSYEGEPAMKLEAAASGGDPFSVDLQLPVEREGASFYLLDSPALLLSVLESLNVGTRTADVAASVHRVIAESLAEAAVELAREHGVKCIGISGGVAFNNLIVSTLKKKVTARGYAFLQHRDISPGDGGVSQGQIAAALSNIL